MTLVRLVRHGRAGHKRDWKGDDALRPLDAVGLRQADALVALLGGEPPAAILSSPTTRCCQTVEPLALAWVAKVETDTRLAKDGGTAGVLHLLRHAGDGDVVCTHGEVMGALLDRLRFGRTEIVAGDGNLLAKGTFWELTLEGSKVRRLRHVDPLASKVRANDR